MFQLCSQADTALRMLRESGYEAYLVGGCVRDFLLGEIPKDYDITTSARPEETKAVFSGFRTVDTGILHGTVTVLLDGVPLEITTYRVEGGYSDARHPDSVRFTNNLREDVSRRDFTMNAVAYAPSEGILDFFGGVQDIEHRMIRSVGDPDQRFQEDALRILRAVRFASVLGFTLESETEQAVFRNRELLNLVSAERIAGELTKLLCGKEAGRVYKTCCPVLRAVLPELPPGSASQDTGAALDRVPPSPVLRWTTLFWKAGEWSEGLEGRGEAGAEKAEAALRRLKVSRRLRDQVIILLKHCATPIPADRKIVRRLLSALPEETFFDLLAIQKAVFSTEILAKSGETMHFDEIETIAHEILQKGECLTVKQLDISATDLIEEGVQGREIGDTLNFLLEAVLDEKIKNRRENLLGYAHKYCIAGRIGP